MYKIALVGGFGLGNFGDDWLLDCAIDRVLNKFRHNEVCVVAPNNRFEVKEYRKIRIVESMDEVVVRNVVYTGGTQFYYYNSRDGASLRKSFNKKGLCCFGVVVLVRRLLNKFRGNYYWSIGLGPFEGREGLLYLERKVKQISRSKYVSFRDGYSQCFLPGTSILGSDICWSWEHKGGTVAPGLRYDVALILRSWNHGGGFSKEDAQRTVDELLKQGISVCVIFLSNHRDDFVIRNVDNFIWTFNNIDFEGHINDLILVLKSSKAVISSRYHGLLLAALVGLPRIAAFNIDPKLSNLSKSLYVPLLKDYADIDGILELLNTRSFCGDYSSEVRRLRKIAEKVGEELFGML